MDAVITYVNGKDPFWQAQYAEFAGKKILDKRFRDWGTLKYLLRGIETCMPYVQNVYLIVSGESQVPQWANRQNLKIVTHKDIIPNEFLPVFSSNPIEMNLHKIEGLSEEFIYFNDDTFPVQPSKPEDFFRNGKVVMKPAKHIFTPNMFRKICRNSSNLAKRAAGKSSCCPVFIRPQHACAPMLRSSNEELYAKETAAINKTTATRVRTQNDVAQYVYTDYLYYMGRFVEGRLSNKHFSLAAASIEDIKGFLKDPGHNFVCINDVRLSEEKYVKYREALLDAFQERFPNKSKYEN